MIAVNNALIRTLKRRTRLYRVIFYFALAFFVFEVSILTAGVSLAQVGSISDFMSHLFELLKPKQWIFGLEILVLYGLYRKWSILPILFLLWLPYLYFLCLNQLTDPQATGSMKLFAYNGTLVAALILYFFFLMFREMKLKKKYHQMNP